MRRVSRLIRAYLITPHSSPVTLATPRLMSPREMRNIPRGAATVLVKKSVKSSFGYKAHSKMDMN